MVPLRFSGLQSHPEKTGPSIRETDSDYKDVFVPGPSQVGRIRWWIAVNDLERFENLVEIMDRLREPQGCPWDREQDYDSLRSYLLEECYEVADAIDRQDHAGLCEELGDLLFQIVFLSRIAKEEDRFTVTDVIRGIAKKMIRRHPHVFGSEKADTPAEVLKNWEEIKRGEKEISSVLDGVPRALPALLKAQRLGTKAARVGFDWTKPSEVLEKIDEELQELREAVAAGDADEAKGEIGDLLFSIVMLARHMGIDPEGALEKTNLKFTSRFSWIESKLEQSGESVEDFDLERLEELWGEAKAALT
jgi:MazG family protein